MRDWCAGLRAWDLAEQKFCGDHRKTELYGVSLNYGYLSAGPHNKDYSILGFILGSPYFEKLPY